MNDIKINSKVTIKYPTHLSDEFEYDRGEVVGSYLDADNRLRYLVRVDGATKDVPEYQVCSN